MGGTLQKRLCLLPLSILPQLCGKDMNKNSVKKCSLLLVLCHGTPLIGTRIYRMNSFSRVGRRLVKEEKRGKSAAGVWGLEGRETLGTGCRWVSWPTGKSAKIADVKMGPWCIPATLCHCKQCLAGVTFLEEPTDFKGFSWNLWFISPDPDFLGSHVTQADFKFSKNPRMTLPSESLALER